jgi:Ran-binding protein 1
VEDVTGEEEEEGRQRLLAEDSFSDDLEEGPGADEDYEPDVQFQPVKSLPLVQVITGEEEEEDILFLERCKLYRYAPDVDNWKERGVGMCKILRHCVSGRTRLLMHPEKVGLVCLNHHLYPGMEFTLTYFTTFACSCFSRPDVYPSM